MLPLHVTWVQDLRTGDAVVKCGACGHTTEIPSSELTRGLGLKPTKEVRDLERRMVCRLCDARGQAAVLIKKATS